MDQGSSNAGQEQQGNRKETLEEMWRTININKFTEEDLNRIIEASLEYRIAEPVQQELVRLVRLVQRVTTALENGEAASWASVASNPASDMPKGSEKEPNEDRKRGYVEKCLSWAGLTSMALLKPDPEILLARGLMTTIETEMLKSFPVLGPIVWKLARNQMFPVAAGLLVNMVVLIFGMGIWWGVGDISDQSALYQQHYKYSIFTMQAAFLGGMMSLIARMPSAAALQDQSVVIMFFTAFFKPWVALIFGGIMFLLLNSQGLGAHLINEAVLKDPHFWGVIGFISGWSERFAPDIITRAAERVRSGAENPRPGLGAAAAPPRSGASREEQEEQPEQDSRSGPFASAAAEQR